MIGVPLADLVIDYSELLMGYKKMEIDLQTYKLDAYVPKMVNVTATWYHGKTRLCKSWRAIRDLGYRSRRGLEYYILQE